MPAKPAKQTAAASGPIDMEIKFPGERKVKIQVPGDSYCRQVVRLLLREQLGVKDLEKEDVRDIEYGLVYCTKAGNHIVNKDDDIAGINQRWKDGADGTWMFRRCMFLRDFKKPVYENGELSKQDMFNYHQFIDDYMCGNIVFKLKELFVFGAYILAGKYGRFEAAAHDPILVNPLTHMPEWFKNCMEWVNGSAKKNYGRALTNQPQFEMLNKTNYQEVFRGELYYEWTNLTDNLSKDEAQDRAKARLLQFAYDSANDYQTMQHCFAIKYTNSEFVKTIGSEILMSVSPYGIHFFEMEQLAPKFTYHYQMILDCKATSATSFMLDTDDQIQHPIECKQAYYVVDLINEYKLGLETVTIMQSDMQ